MAFAAPANAELQRLDDQPMDVLVKVADEVRGYMLDADASAKHVSQLQLERRLSLFSRLFPTAFEREQQRLASSTVRAIAESKLALLEYHAELQLAMAKQKGQTLLAAQGSKLTTALAAFVSAQQDDLQVTINDSRRKFLTRIDPEFDFIAQYEHRPELYQPALASLQRQIDAYFRNQDGLLENFNRALENVASHATQARSLS